MTAASGSTQGHTGKTKHTSPVTPRTHVIQLTSRLEPSLHVPDIGIVGSQNVPMRLVWWRSSSETSVRRRCPIFCAETGLSPCNMGIDWLHTLALGVFQYWLAILLNDLFSNNAYNVGPGSQVSALRELNFNRFKEELFAWYGSEARLGRQHTRIQKCTLNMFGTEQNPTCALYGAETNSLLAFSAVLLCRRGACLGDRYRAHCLAGESLRDMLAMIRDNPRKFPAAAMVKFCSAVQKHLWSVRELKFDHRPKHHFMIEMAGRTSQI